ncbi:MAG TPA: PLP-dependent aspartate aminotransferase family protein [Chitinophagales bacterium]|nr:PLP-dependent aspartate aminotransferase family protein [Chitinophagales bacterium]HRG84979.1 PLP-dependent aspartate aminotransferase family protein [Chitinophagales bacterium]HRH53212.1 PLP-dependent aspartate aminotransferase family protein [Chitinophagales bacterium]
MDISYILNILGEERGNYFNAVAPPIIQTSNFAFKTVAEFRNATKDELHAHLYTRGNNPTTEIVRKKIAALEGTDDCLIFSSGAAAIAAAILHSVKSGDHVICVESPYSWTYYMLTQVFPLYGVTTTFVDGKSIENFENAIQPNTKLIFLESPNTFWLDLQDLAAICNLAKAKNIITAIDNSYCTPLYQQAHQLGVDLVIHTATKYLAGHSDVVSGVICANQEHINSIFKTEFMAFGAIPSPNDTWLLLRGMRTLPMRLEKSAGNAEKLINWLEQHPKVEKIIYPFHHSHPQFELAKKQMQRGSGLFAVLLKTQDKNKIEAFCNKLQRFLLAVSWGGYESLVFPACIKEGSDYPVNFVRFYAGLEEADVLIEDINQALSEI